MTCSLIFGQRVTVDKTKLFKVVEHAKRLQLILESESVVSCSNSGADLEINLVRHDLKETIVFTGTGFQCVDGKIVKADTTYYYMISAGLGLLLGLSTHLIF